MSEIVKAELSLGRAEFRVAKGQAAGYALTTTAATGAAWVEAAIVPPSSNPTRLIAGAARRTTAAGSAVTTTVRFFNTAATAAKVTLSPVGFGRSSVDIMLNAGELREIPDILGSVLGADGEAAGAIAVQSSAAVIVQAHTSTAGGAVGPLNAISPPASLVSEGSSATLIGLRGASATVGFVTTTGAAAGLTLKDMNGNVAAARDAAIALEAGSAREIVLTDLFPGVEIPDDAVLVISVTTGSLIAYLQTTDPVTGDWWIETAGQ